jgi:hypothetical protein
MKLRKLVASSVFSNLFDRLDNQLWRGKIGDLIHDAGGEKARQYIMNPVEYEVNGILNSVTAAISRFTRRRLKTNAKPD